MSKESKIYKYSLGNHIKLLFSHIDYSRKKQFILLLFLMIISAFAEVFSIGLILPFLSILMDPIIVFEHTYAVPMINILNIKSPEGLLLPVTLIFGFAALLAGGIRLLLLFWTTRLAYSAGSDITIDIYRKTLYQPYSTHVDRNSSEVINVMVSKANAAIQSTLIPVMQIISSLIMLTVTLTFLIMVEPFITSVTFLGFGLIYLVIIFFTNYRLSSNSKRISFEHNQVVKLLQEGLGGIRDIILSGNQELYTDMYRKSDIPLRRAQGINVFIGASPRFGIEALAMFLLGFMAYYSTLSEGGISQAIPIIGMLALGAQRLLPVIQQIFVSWSSIQSSRVSVEDTIDFLDQKLPNAINAELKKKSFNFSKELVIEDLSFRYSEEEPWVFQNLNFSLKKGSRVGLIGSTGSGKSTLIDLIMGLLEPTSGKIIIDGIEMNYLNVLDWQMKLAQVPQNIFLSDSSIRKNIAFGVENEFIDEDLLNKVSEKAKIRETILNWPNGFETNVGERGLRLSGGQKQRIGIARALYRTSDVIIFDEATSALDNETESEVIKDIYNLGDKLTILMIAHRLSTLRECDQIFEINKQGITEVDLQNY